MYSDSFLHNITSPTCITAKSKALFNNYNPNFLSRNIMTTLSDHIAQFLLMKFQTKLDEKYMYMYIYIYTDFDETKEKRDLITHQKSVKWKIRNYSKHFELLPFLCGRLSFYITFEKSFWF